MNARDLIALHAFAVRRAVAAPAGPTYRAPHHPNDHHQPRRDSDRPSSSPANPRTNA